MSNPDIAQAKAVLSAEKALHRARIIDAAQAVIALIEDPDFLDLFDGELPQSMMNVKMGLIYGLGIQELATTTPVGPITLPVEPS
jgi:hypothetical protein